jgi:hypothetical protein
MPTEDDKPDVIREGLKMKTPDRKNAPVPDGMEIEKGTEKR